MSGERSNQPYIRARTGELYTSQPGWSNIVCNLVTGSVAANVPTWANVVNSVSAWRFDAGTMNEMAFAVQIPRDYKNATMIYPHVHWSGNGTNTGVCRWGIEYTWARGYSADAFPATATIYLEQAATGTANVHQIAEQTLGSGLTLTGLEPDSIILGRLFRDAANAADTLTNQAFAYFVDIHYESDGKLTNERNRTFTKREY